MRQEQIIKPNDPLKILVPGALAQAFGLNLQQSNELVVPSFADKENVIDKSIKPKTLAALETIQKGTKKEATWESSYSTFVKPRQSEFTQLVSSPLFRCARGVKTHLLP